MESVEAAPATETEATPAPAPEADFSLPDETAEMEAVWDKHNVNNGAGRDPESGKFKSDKPAEAEAEAEEPPASPVEGEGEEGEPQAAESSTPDAPTETALPPSYRGLEDTWAQIPDDLKPVLAEHGNKLHKTLSDQGVELARFRPLNDVLERNKDQFSHVRGNDGRPVAPADAVDYLFAVNRGMNTQPVKTLLEIADTFGVRQQIAAALGGDGEAPAQGATESLLREEIAGLERRIQSMLDPAKFDERISAKLQEDRTNRDADELVSRLSQDKPLYKSIPEETMVQFIHLARQKRGEAASPEDVFNLAYDMAVHADPELRAKHAAAQPAPAAPDPKRTETAKRSNSVNVTSTSSGKSTPLTEDEELAAVWDKNRKG